MMTEDDLRPTLLRLIGDPLLTSGAILALNEVAQDGQELGRTRYLLEYAEGYKLWLQAGLGLLTSGELQEIGQSAPDVVSAFRKRIAQKGNPFRNA